MPIDFHELRTVFRDFGSPQLKAPTVLITGTNGKGSTATYVAGMLHHIGYRVGLLTSPHVVDICERFRINGENIAASQLKSIYHFILKYKHADQLGFYNTMTLLGSLYFASENVDVAVLEVGMGGRLDATNLSEPQISSITTVDYDHTEHLGDSLDEILKEKLPIARHSRPLVFAEPSIKLQSIANDYCRTNGIPLIAFNRDYTLEKNSLEQPCLHYDGSYFKLDNKSVPPHQLQNQALARLIVHLFDSRTIDHFNWHKHALPGRYQQIDNWLVDMAHNDQSLARLSQNFQNYNLIIAKPLKSSWDYGLKQIVSRSSTVICPEMANNYFTPAQFFAEQIKGICGNGKSVRVAESVAKALEQSANNQTLICGSCRIAGKVLEILLKQTPTLLEL